MVRFVPIFVLSRQAASLKSAARREQPRLLAPLASGATLAPALMTGLLPIRSIVAGLMEQLARLYQLTLPLLPDLGPPCRA